MHIQSVSSAQIISKLLCLKHLWAIHILNHLHIKVVCDASSITLQCIWKYFSNNVLSLLWVSGNFCPFLYHSGAEGRRSPFIEYILQVNVASRPLDLTREWSASPFLKNGLAENSNKMITHWEFQILPKLKTQPIRFKDNSMIYGNLILFIMKPRS